MINLKEMDLFLLDMDGTIYIEDRLIDGAKEFISKIISIQKKYVFLTNNSSVNKNNYIDKMKKLDIQCTEENIFSSGMATGIFLKENRPNQSVYLVGTLSLEEELKHYGVSIVDKNPDIVVVGFDRELCYRKLELACEFLDNGAEFIATNADFLYPIKNHRFIPDCASICSMLTAATQKKPFFIGKPNRYMIDILSSKYNIPHHKIVIIGDRLYTDIASGINAGVNTICVLSGETNEKILLQSEIKPNFTVQSIQDLINLL